MSGVDWTDSRDGNGEVQQNRSSDRLVAGWLAVICIVIFAIIIVGGVTRLTDSGLSMVDWRPVMGTLPPVTDAAWNEAFEAYKRYPEYQKINRGMALAEFKVIFYWEYAHRLLGRIIGLLFFIPFVILLWLKKIPSRMLPRLAFAFVLGGCQGLLGWYMVRSGLVDVPHVSHFRLAAHLSLAMFLLAFLFWQILDLLAVGRFRVMRSASAMILLVSGLFVLQVVYGAFVAGLNAGLGFNTYPLMDGQFMADAATMMTPLWLNLVENGAMIQFIHRWLGLALLLCVTGALMLFLRRDMAKPLRAGWLVLLLALLLQFVLGIATLLMHVPVSLASLHQAGAVFVMLVVVYILYAGRRPV